VNRCMRAQSSAGVILVRFHNRARRAKPATVVEAVTKFGSATVRHVCRGRSRTCA
jgi:hypothetical protein